MPRLSKLTQRNLRAVVVSKVTELAAALMEQHGLTIQQAYSVLLHTKADYRSRIAIECELQEQFGSNYETINNAIDRYLTKILDPTYQPPTPGGTRAGAGRKGMNKEK